MDYKENFKEMNESTKELPVTNWKNLWESEEKGEEKTHNPFPNCSKTIEKLSIPLILLNL